MKNNQIVGLLLAAVAIVGGIIYLSKDKVGPGIAISAPVDVVVPQINSAPQTPQTPQTLQTPAVPSASDRIAEKAKQFDRAKEIASPAGFVNTDGKPITISQYVGKKVILLDIMTYSCINCIRTFPYVNDWYTKYEDKGLIIIGIHTPEFDFEKNIDNVKAAMAKYNIKFPVVLDNDYGTWNAYNNRYWPMKYLIDIDGFVRFKHIGEGGYDETEKNIQDLLKERASVLGLDSSIKFDGTVKPAETKVVEQGTIGQSPETYFGSARNEFFGNRPQADSATSANNGTFTLPNQLVLNTFYLDGAWNIQTDHIENTAIPAKIVYTFASKKVYLVASADTAVSVDIIIDGKMQNSIVVKDARLYDLYSGDTFGRHVLEIRPQTKGLKAFTLTFGN